MGMGESAEIGGGIKLFDKISRIPKTHTARPLNWRERGRNGEKVSQRFSLF
jgi:hypothetical protein